MIGSDYGVMEHEMSDLVGISYVDFILLSSAWTL